MSLAGNTALITGGTSGIGRSLARSLIAGRGWHLLNEIASATPTRCGTCRGHHPGN
jgi:NAD(P)-dependent dehydrogenase (short-subunit alcohol dehydrogenase family)